MKTSSGEIRALITLLGDDDLSIRDVARERLLQFGSDAEEFLKEATGADLEGKVRIEARHVLQKIRLDDLIASFSLLGLLDDEQIDLEHAAFLVARIGYPDVDVVEYQQELDELADRIRYEIRQFNLERNGRQIVQRVNRVLFGEEGFCGNSAEYYDPDNSYLNRVLERRTGIPVSLSLIYLLISRRLGLPIRGINMPVHFICQYLTPHESFFIDPYNDGRIITRAECMMLVRGSGHSFHESFLQPARPKRIIGRMVRNLILIYYQREDTAKAILLDRILKMLRIPE